MSSAAELIDLFRRNFPYVVRSDATVSRLLSDAGNRVFERRDEQGRMIAASVAHGSAIYMLCVDAAYRRRGIGGALLVDTEEWLRAQGYTRATLGAGDDYLMPGVPTSVKPWPEELAPDALYPELSDSAWSFFARRGYSHSWKGCNCFDMRLSLGAFEYDAHAIGDEIDGVRYRWATPSDMPEVCRCTDDAHAGFTQYYIDESLYTAGSAQRALVATEDGRVCGALIVGVETECSGVGSAGCTAVIHACRGRHIAANMILLGTRYLRERGLSAGFIGYTYSGLDRLYGIAGYSICAYYAMGEKPL